MKIETVNVVERVDNQILQIIAFIGENAEAEAAEMFRTLILEHNDPDNDPPQNVLGFEDEVFDLMVKEGEYDDENGYVLSIVHSACLTKKEEDQFTNWHGNSDGSVGSD